MLDSLQKMLDNTPAEETESCSHCGEELSDNNLSGSCDECGRDGCDECIACMDLHDPTEKEDVIFLCKKCLENKYEVVKK